MTSNTVRALLVGIDANRAAALTSAFHRLGYIFRASSVDEVTAMGSALRNEHPNLVVFDDSTNQLETGLGVVKNQPQDLPVIVLSSAEEVLPNHEIADVIAPDNIERLARSCLREFLALQTRQEMKEIQAQLDAAEERSKMLLSQSDEAIAYITDGMIINANQLFADHFGFANAEDLDYQPLFDLIQEQDHERMKNALRSAMQGDSAKISVSGQNQGGEEINAAINLSSAVLDGENCVQLTIRSEGAQENGSTAVAATVDNATGFQTAAQFLHYLDDVAAHGMEGGANGFLHLINVDDYTRLRTDFGLDGIDDIARDLSALLRVEMASARFGRLDGDLIAAVLSEDSEEAALHRAQKLCKQVGTRKVTVKEQTTGYHISVAVVPMGMTRNANAGVLISNALSVCDEIRNNGGNKASLFVRARQQLDQSAEALHLFEDARTDKRLQLLFQPIVGLAEEKANYYEVRLSLKDREQGEISANDLLRAFESQGSNTELDRWILVESTKKLAALGSNRKNIRLILNLTSNVARDKTFLPWLHVALKAAELSADALIFQFRGESCHSSIGELQSFASECRRLGSNIALRTANAASSDQSTIEKLKPLITKLDQDVSDTESLKEAILSVQEAGSAVVVQGVESAANLATLWQLKPNYVQGSYIQPASTAMDYNFGEE